MHWFLFYDSLCNWLHGKVSLALEWQNHEFRLNVGNLQVMLESSSVFQTRSL